MCRSARPTSHAPTHTDHDHGCRSAAWRTAGMSAAPDSVRAVARNARAARTGYRCADCGYEAAKWIGRCPQCQAWGTLDQAAPATFAVAGVDRKSTRLNSSHTV